MLPVDFMDSLDDKILEHVFSFIQYLDWKAVLLTCKRFWRVGTKIFNPARDDNAAIKRMAMLGNLDAVRALLRDPRVDPSANDNAAIGLASRGGHLEVVKELLKDPRVNPSTKDNYAIKKALKYRNWLVLRELLKDKRLDFVHGHERNLSPEEHRKIKRIRLVFEE